MNETKIKVGFAKTTVDAIDFPVTSDDLKLMAHGYYMERLAYEYECWAEGADFAPNTQEWFDYHFAGERLNAIEKIIGQAQTNQAKSLAESAFLFNNRIDNDQWIEFRKAAYGRETCDHCGEVLTDKDRDNTDGHDTLGFFVKCDTCKKLQRLCEDCWNNTDDCNECEPKAIVFGSADLD